MRSSHLIHCSCALPLSLITFSILSFLWIPPVFAATSSTPKPTLDLNVRQGPLGAILTVKGKNFHAGQASFSYVDAQNIPGIFSFPSDSGVQISANGSFISTNIMLPTSGPIGDWKIVVTDSAETVSMATYHVLGTTGSQSGAAPSIMINPMSGKASDLIAFSGSNWLPKGTNIKLSLLVGVTTFPLLAHALTSDENGTITGAFSLPTAMDPQQSSATIIATDTSGALHAVLLMTLIAPIPTPVVSPTATSLPTPVLSPTNVAVTSAITKSTPPNHPTEQALALSPEALGIVILLVGGTLGIAGVALLLFLLPWSEQKQRNL